MWHADRDAYSSRHLVPSLWDLHMYLLRPILFPNLSLFLRTMLFEYPSVLSRFCCIHLSRSLFLNSNYNQVTSDPDVRSSVQSSSSFADSSFLYPPVCVILSQATLPLSLTKDYGHFLRRGLNTDFDPELILLNVGVLSRKDFRHIANEGVNRKAS